MTRVEFFLYCINRGLYRHRAWLLASFGQVIGVAKIDDETTMGFIDGVFTYKDSEITITVSDHKDNAPIFPVFEEINLKAGDMVSVKEDIRTTYGNALINALLFIYPYGDKVPFQNKQLSGKDCNKIANDMLVSTKDVAAHKKYEAATGYFRILGRGMVQGASEKSITLNPKIIALRDKLFKDHAHEITVPSVAASIQKQLAQAIKDDLKDDPSSRFFISGKSYDVSLLRTYVTFGSEPDFYDESKISVMKNSLADGWDIADLPMLVNALRGGIHGRGVQTALGGVGVKESTRVFQNYSITIEDCGSKDGIIFPVNSNTAKFLVGRYILGSDVPMTEEDVKKRMGKGIGIRSPWGCKAPRPTHCAKCCGDTVAKSGVGLNGQCLTAMSAFLLLFMKAMHTTALSTHRYDYKARIN